MTGPQNSRYQRHFVRPEDRPSNMPFPQWAAGETLNRIRDLHQWMDQQDGEAVVSGAEALLASEARRRAARTHGWTRGGEPGA